MPGIQDIYSVNVSNRYALGGDTDEESDTAPDYDPLDTLKSLEDQKKRALEEAKKKKQAVANKSKNQKKPARFQENKDSNIPVKKESVPPKSAKPPRQQNVDRKEGPPRANNRRPPRERPNYGEGDENRRPPRRRNEMPRNDVAAPGGEGVEQPKGDQSFGRSGGEFGPRRDRAERYRGGRGANAGGGRGGYQGGRYFGGNRHDGRDDRGKREFDRRSGSDRSSVKPSDKRDGAGPRNWGTPGNEIEEEATEPVGTWKEPAVESEEKEATEKEAEEKEEEKEEKPEEPSEMTLDEWKAKQESLAKPSFNIRKPGEGEDQAKWKNMKVLRKVDKPEEKHESMADDQHKRQGKHQVNMNIQFGDNSARGFGGRGRGRGDRGRGRGGRGGRYGGDRNQSRQLMPDVLNEQEFPTLG